MSGSRINPFMHNFIKWQIILQKYCGVKTARFLKYVWPIYNIMDERIKVWQKLCNYDNGLSNANDLRKRSYL